jgi:hypothetical protein
MAKAIAVKIGNQTVLVETDETIDIPAKQVRKGTSRRRLPEGAEEVVSIEDIKKGFADVKEVVIACCNNLYSAVQKIPAPERFAIEFGVKLAGEKGIPLLTKVSGEATFKIMVEWKSE